MKDSKIDAKKSDRILSFLQSHEITESELKQIAGAGETIGTPNASYNVSTGASDMYCDVRYDW